MESLKCVGKSSVRGLRKCVMYFARLSVGLSKPEMIGLRGMVGLCVLGRP